MAIVAMAAACAKPQPASLVSHRTPTLVAADLKAHRLCWRERDPVSGVELYASCSEVGSSDMTQWATASYDRAGQLVVVDRYERWDDETKALTHWNSLVAKAIERYGAPTTATREAAVAWQLVPKTAVYWSAHQAGASLLVLAYTKPDAPTYAHVVEAVAFDARAKIAPLHPR